MNALIDLQFTLQASALALLKEIQAGGWAGLPGLALSAFAFGLLHALLPGHGKALLGARFAQEGSPREALGLSALIIALHVASAIVLVLTGAELLSRAIGSAGRALWLEKASNVLIALIGVWLLVEALRGHAHERRRSGLGLALAAGLVPCPLTTFMMTYAVARGVTGAGLILSLFFGLGMIVTVVLFPLASLKLRQYGLFLALARGLALERAARAVALLSALAILVIGLLPLLR